MSIEARYDAPWITSTVCNSATVLQRLERTPSPERFSERRWLYYEEALSQKIHLQRLHPSALRNEHDRDS